MKKFASKFPLLFALVITAAAMFCILCPMVVVHFAPSLLVAAICLWILVRAQKKAQAKLVEVGVQS